MGAEGSSYRDAARCWSTDLTPQLPQHIKQVIDQCDEDSLVAIYVKKLICNSDIEFESLIKARMSESDKKFHYFSICYEAHNLPFPEPHINRVYFFKPKSNWYELAVDAGHLARDFHRVVQVIGKRADEVAHLYPEHKQAPDRHITPEKEKEQAEMLKSEDISKFPSAFQMARNLAKSAWDTAKGVASGRQILVKAEEAHRRYSICEGCENLKDKRCTHCGCFMEHKTQLEAATCPLNKW